VKEGEFACIVKGYHKWFALNAFSEMASINRVQSPKRYNSYKSSTSSVRASKGVENYLGWLLCVACISANVFLAYYISSYLGNRDYFEPRVNRLRFRSFYCGHVRRFNWRYRHHIKLACLHAVYCSSGTGSKARVRRACLPLVLFHSVTERTVNVAQLPTVTPP